ncbi:MAG: hypothetical protein ACI9WL_001411 [Rubritalea sp.]|jgi:hypothetical protein
MKNYIKIMLLLCAVHRSNAQEQNLSHSSSWNSFIPTVKIDNSFYVTTEFHFRRTHFLQDWEQFIARPAIHFKKNDTYDFALGYSYIRNYAFSDFTIPIDANEHNLWQQVQLNHAQDKIKFKHRFRLEERFIDKIATDSTGNSDTDGTTCNHRFRYRFTLTRPILKISDTQSIFIELFDELFINLEEGTRPKSFNQNWIYAGLGYPITSKIGLGIGYHNIGLKGGTNTFITNHMVQTTLTYVMN